MKHTQAMPLENPRITIAEVATKLAISIVCPLLETSSHLCTMPF
jgi:hypothetical protein